MLAARKPALGPALREAVHRSWLEQALIEHGWVAASARFSLQLLALGAPAALCEQAAGAMRDEITHARDCFELARRHSDSDVRLGPLDMTGALDAIELQEIVLGTIAEGCIGGTVAAMEAAEALAHCEDEVARATLARIARDETRHAELAWQFVAWALEVGPEPLREWARAAFAEAARGGAGAHHSEPPRPAARAPWLDRVGVAGRAAAARRARRDRALRERVARLAGAPLERRGCRFGVDVCKRGSGASRDLTSCATITRRPRLAHMSCRVCARARV